MTTKGNTMQETQPITNYNQFSRLVINSMAEVIPDMPIRQAIPLLPTAFKMFVCLGDRMPRIDEIPVVSFLLSCRVHREESPTLHGLYADLMPIIDDPDEWSLVSSKEFGQVTELPTDAFLVELSHNANSNIGEDLTIHDFSIHQYSAPGISAITIQPQENTHE